MQDDIRPRGTVEVECSTPNCTWRFWVAADDAKLPTGPFFCSDCSEHATYKFVCSHRQEASKFLAEAQTVGSLLHHTLTSRGDVRIRVTIEEIVPGEN